VFRPHQYSANGEDRIAQDPSYALERSKKIIKWLSKQSH